MSSEFNQESDTAPRAERLSSLGQSSNLKRTHSKGYSDFIRIMKIALPVVALGIVGVIFTWNTMQDQNLAPVKIEEKKTASMSKNELVNPEFESVDSKNQPFTITANRAVQDAADELMLLEEPLADIVLNSGNWVAIQSRQGAYRQESQRLLLKDNVTLFHDDGYTARTEELNVDMKDGKAQTDLKVSAFGPAGELDASGMQADTKDDVLIFTGPAKLVIYDTKAPALKGFAP